MAIFSVGHLSFPRLRRSLPIPVFSFETPVFTSLVNDPGNIYLTA